MNETHWVIVDEASGAILQRAFVTGGCHPRHAGWDWDGETQACHKVPAELLSDYIARRLEWNGTAFAENLTEARGQKWAAVKSKRDELENGNAPTPFGPLQCDDRSKLKISGLVQMAQIAWSAECAAAAAADPPREPDPACFAEEFTLADNSVAILDAQTAVILGIAVGRYVSAIHACARELRARIDAAETLAAVAAIDIEAASWPAAGE